MDPITHGVIGLAISAFSGDPVALNNPISIACALGAMSPDIDIIAKIKGDYAYLKHHRGISHSIPALLGLAGVITLGLSPFFLDFQFLQVFFWAFIGCLSHTLFDILNSYGAKLFMPFSRKKLVVGILMLYDPVITILSFLLIFKREKSLIFYLAIILSFILYLSIRWMMKKEAHRRVKKYYGLRHELVKINILPALMAFHKWDFVLVTDKYYIVGQMNILNGKIKKRETFIKPDEEVVEMFEETKMGRYFRDFTPIYHIVYLEEMGKIILKSIDLRYYLRNNYMHHATVIYDDEKNIIQSFFHPYNINKRIPVLEGK